MDLSEYKWFTDIEFNPPKSINCQARTVAVYQLLQKNNWWDILNNKKEWIEFQFEFIQG